MEITMIDKQINDDDFINKWCNEWVNADSKYIDGDNWWINGDVDGW